MSPSERALAERALGHEGLRQHERHRRKQGCCRMGASSPESSHGFPATSRDGLRLPGESTPTPQCSSRGPEVDEIIAQFGHCRGTAPTNLYSRIREPGTTSRSKLRLIGLFSVGRIGLPEKTSHLARLTEGVQVLKYCADVHPRHRDPKPNEASGFLATSCRYRNRFAFSITYYAWGKYRQHFRAPTRAFLTF